MLTDNLISKNKFPARDNVSAIFLNQRNNYF